jgi:hypothetical protein
MAHKVYENFVLANEIEDQYNSHLDLARFCTIDNSLVGTPGMEKKINVYRATNGTEKLAMGAGNSKDIEVTYTEETYRILLAQNRFKYYDEQEMTDPMIVTTGVRHMATDMFNTVNDDVFAEFGKATITVPVTAFNFDAFADAGAALNVENLAGLEKFAFVHPKDMAKIRKACKDQLSYVQNYIGQGYVATLGDWNLFVKKDATEGVILGGTKDAVTLFNKKGTEVEQDRDKDIRENTVWSRKYYLAALTDATKAVKITLGE